MNPPLPAKLTPPRPTRVHPRQRLFRRLDDWRGTPLIWISAPAGSGKTTLAVSYLQARDIPPLWYRIDRGDSDLASFFHYLKQGCEAGQPNATLPTMTAEYQGDPGAFARLFFRRLFAAMDEPAVLVLDDMEALYDDTPFNQALSQGLEEIPPGCQVMVLSRSEPPAPFARAEMDARMARLHWHDLQLTDDEGRAIARLLTDAPHLPASHLEHRLRAAHGWVAALILQLRSDTRLHGTDGTPAGLAQHTFDAYFASECFQHLPAATRTLLLSTAWLDAVGPEDAARLSGREDAGARLNWLASRQLFVSRLAGGRPAYRYHPLLRRFLQHHAAQALSPAALVDLKRRSAACLAEAGEIDPAAELWRDIGDWAALEHLIRDHAQHLLHQGRHRHLHHWLDALPTERLDADPWLHYWLGAATLAFAPRGAGTHFRAAYPRFLQENDPLGAYTCWLGIMDSLIYANDSLEEVPHWLDQRHTLEARLGPCPDPVLAARVAFTAFNMGFTACPQRHPADHWRQEAERLRRLLPGIDDDTSRCLAAVHLAMCFTWHPQPARLKLLADMLRPLADDERVAPLARILAHLVDITHRWNAPETDGSAQRIESALALVERHGISVGRLWLLSAGTLYHLSQGDTTGAARLLDHYRRHIRVDQRHEQVHYHYLAGWLAHLQGDPELACEHTARAHSDIRPLHSPHFELLACAAHAFMLIETGQEHAAQRLIDHTRRRARQTHSRSVAVFQLGLLEAWSAWRRGDPESAAAHLRPALACGREMDLRVVLWHLPAVLSRLCALALEHGIETAYVHRLIRRNALLRPPQADPLLPWPDALRIHTLGRFTIECHGRRLEIDCTAQRKPLKLLKLIIALGAESVPAARIEDTLWPESDGASARRALITTLQRLRRLLGLPQAVRFEDGRLSLDRRHVWLDTWALNECLAHDDPQRTERALPLYRGRLFMEEDDPPWILAGRERLHAAVLRGYERAINARSRHAQWERLIELCQNGLDIDDLHEPFYREQIRALTALGRHAQAVRLYRDCRDRLQTSLGIAPSPATRALIES